MNEKLKNVFEKLEMLKDAIEQFSKEVDEERVIIKKESFSKIEFINKYNGFHFFKFDDLMFFTLFEGFDYQKELLEKFYSANLDRLILNKHNKIIKSAAGYECNYYIEAKEKTILKDLYPESEI